MSATKLWYPHNIEKYRRKTGHLTIAEHGAYRLLMDAYWDRRGPLPADETRLRKLIGADKDEWESVRDAVLEFFTLTEDGWRHETIEENLSEAERLHRDKAERLAKAREAKRLKAEQDKALSTEQDTGLTEGTQSPSPSQSHILTDTEEPVLGADAPKKTKPPSAHIKEILETVLSPETAADVIDHRKTIRKPLTVRAAKGLAERYARCRDGPEAAAEYHITSGNQGFEPEWYDNAKRTADNRKSNAPGKVDDLRELRDQAKEFDRRERESVSDHGEGPERRAIGAR